METIDSLAQSDLFGGLDAETWTRVAARLTAMSSPAGRRILTEGDRGDTYYLIVSGEVAVFKGSGVSRCELGRLGPGAGFGEMSLLADEPRSASVESVTDVVFLCLTRDRFHALMEQEPWFAPRILRLMSTRLRQTNQVAATDLLRAHQGLIMSLAALAESRDPDTGAHLHRVRDYCALLANRMKEDRRFAGAVDADFVEMIYYVSPLHDIGKVGVPDSILCKRGRLTEEEFEIIKTHTVIGAMAIDKVLHYCDLEMFRMARDIVMGHHERFDGQGYPRGVEGTSIPLSARIMTIADFYDALRSKRAYKPALDQEETLEAVRESVGVRFDPDVAEIFLNHADEFDGIHRKYQALDRDSTLPLEPDQT